MSNGKQLKKKLTEIADTHIQRYSFTKTKKATLRRLLPRTTSTSTIRLWFWCVCGLCCYCCSSFLASDNQISLHSTFLLVVRLKGWSWLSLESMTNMTLVVAILASNFVDLLSILISFESRTIEAFAICLLKTIPEKG